MVEDVENEDSDDEFGPSLAEKMAARGLVSTIQPAATSASTAIDVDDEIVEGIESMSIKKKPAASRKRTKAKVPTANADDTPQKPAQKKKKPAAKKAATKKVQSESEEEFDLAADSEDEIDAAHLQGPEPCAREGRLLFADDSEDEDSEADDDDNEATLNSCVMTNVAASSGRSWRGLCDLHANNQHLPHLQYQNCHHLLLRLV